MGYLMVLWCNFLGAFSSGFGDVDVLKFVYKVFMYGSSNP